MCIRDSVGCVWLVGLCGAGRYSSAVGVGITRIGNGAGILGNDVLVYRGTLLLFSWLERAGLL